MTKILDIQQSITAANGNTSLAKELFTMLLTDLTVRSEQIDESFQSNNMSMLAEHIHKLYGATAYCIVPKLRHYTGILEDKLRQADFAELEQLVNNVRHEIQQLIQLGPDFIDKDWSEFEHEA